MKHCPRSLSSLNTQICHQNQCVALNMCNRLLLLFLSSLSWCNNSKGNAVTRKRPWKEKKTLQIKSKERRGWVHLWSYIKSRWSQRSMWHRNGGICRGQCLSVCLTDWLARGLLRANTAGFDTWAKTSESMKGDRDFMKNISFHIYLSSREFSHYMVFDAALIFTGSSWSSVDSRSNPKSSHAPF